MNRFKGLLPDTVRLEPFCGDESIELWEARDESDALVGYAFSTEVPEVVPDIPGMDEMDRYLVAGMVDPQECRIVSIEISLHPDSAGEPWTTEIAAPEFQKQYIGLSVEQIDLSPDGKIDAITDATLSSTWITDTIRKRVAQIVDRVKAKA